MNINIPPGPCPECGRSLRMGQSTCLKCGFDRMTGVNINEKHPRQAWWRYVLCTPIGFMLMTGGLAVLLAFIAEGHDQLIRMYFVMTTAVVLVTAVLVMKAIAANPPSLWVFYSDWAADSYRWDLLWGRGGAVGMQSLVVLSSVLIGLSVWLETGLPEDQRIIAPALGFESSESDRN
jgi:hypothetical protein